MSLDLNGCPISSFARRVLFAFKMTTISTTGGSRGDSPAFANLRTIAGLALDRAPTSAISENGDANDQAAPNAYFAHTLHPVLTQATATDAAQRTLLDALLLANPLPDPSALLAPAWTPLARSAERTAAAWSVGDFAFSSGAYRSVSVVPSAASHVTTMAMIGGNPGALVWTAVSDEYHRSLAWIRDACAADIGVLEKVVVVDATVVPGAAIVASGPAANTTATCPFVVPATEEKGVEEEEETHSSAATSVHGSVVLDQDENTRDEDPVVVVASTTNTQDTTDTGDTTVLALDQQEQVDDAPSASLLSIQLQHQDSAIDSGNRIDSAAPTPKETEAPTVAPEVIAHKYLIPHQIEFLRALGTAAADALNRFASTMPLARASCEVEAYRSRLEYALWVSQLHAARDLAGLPIRPTAAAMVAATPMDAALLATAATTPLPRIIAGRPIPVTATSRIPRHVSRAQAASMSDLGEPLHRRRRQTSHLAHGGARTATTTSVGRGGGGTYDDYLSDSEGVNDNDGGSMASRLEGESAYESESVVTRDPSPPPPPSKVIRGGGGSGPTGAATSSTTIIGGGGGIRSPTTPPSVVTVASTSTRGRQRPVKATHGYGGGGGSGHRTSGHGRGRSATHDSSHFSPPTVRGGGAGGGVSSSGYGQQFTTAARSQSPSPSRPLARGGPAPPPRLSAYPSTMQAGPRLSRPPSMSSMASGPLGSMLTPGTVFPPFIPPGNLGLGGDEGVAKQRVYNRLSSWYVAQEKEQRLIQERMAAYEDKYRPSLTASPVAVAAAAADGRVSEEE
ncbi:hypothetical protein BC828DRAFT_77366 [Blastocladiella britannica]|nr:hypothetical protein BC828DRAFT_77366 [Blastocladiella britannica]